MKSILVLLTLLSFTFGLEIGDKAPSFSLNTMEGNSFTQLSDGSDSGPVMLIFWATWCPSCKEEIPHVRDIHESFTSKGLRVLAINVGVNDSQKRVQKFSEKYKMSYPVTFDAGSKVTKEYGVMGTPTVMIIDQQGIVRYKSSVLPENLEDHFESLLL